MRFILLAFLVFTPLMSGAQIIPILDAPLEIEVIPSSPNPGDSVLFIARNTPSQGEVLYEWRVDGSIYDQGIGRDRITVTAGNVGENFSVSLSVFVDGNFYTEKTRIIRPGGIDIVWEGKTYTPPFYSGLPLPNRESRITLLAVPNVIHNGVRVSADNLNYEWFINNSRRYFENGRGASSVTTEVPGFGGPFNVTVVARTDDKLIEVRETISIAPVESDVLIYEKSPLLGVRFDKLIRENFNLEEGEITFIGYPLYSSPINSLSFAWKVDNSPVEPGESSREITLRREGEGVGRFNVSLSYEGIERLFERVSKNFLLTF